MLDFDDKKLFDEKGSKLGFHTNDNINSFNADVNLVIGRRANGKSYSTLAFDCIKNFIDSDYENQFAYIRRFDSEMSIIRKYIFNGMVENGWLEWYSKGKWNDVQYWQNCWYLRRINRDGEVEEKLSRPMAFSFCINTSGKAKGPDYVGIKTIVFDEFIPINHMYAAHEIENWQNLISTIDRNRNNIKIYMIANTVSKECPHFDYYGIDPDVLEQGKIYVSKVGTKGKLAIEYCNDVGDVETKESVYFNLEDEVGSMILGGGWQNRKFPALPESINVNEQTIFSVYIMLREKLIRANFISLENTSTIYFERVDDYKLDIDDLVYIDEEYCDSMLYENVKVRFSTSDNIARTMLRYLNEKRCFYDSDDTGEKVSYFASL